jgi:hypothetical protein
MAVISAPLVVGVCVANAHHIEGCAETSHKKCHETNQFHPSKSRGAI